jgi:ketosteroid isomerase-like protein
MVLTRSQRVARQLHDRDRSDGRSTAGSRWPRESLYCSWPSGDGWAVDTKPVLQDRPQGRFARLRPVSLRSTTFVNAIVMDREYTDRLLATVRTAATEDISDPQTVLHGVYSAVIQGDFDAFGESVTEDVELSICGFGHLDGTWRSRNEVVAATRRNFAEVESQRPENEGMISQGDCVAVLLRESGVFKSTGQAYSVRGVQWFTFADGKIKKIDEIVASVLKIANP